MKGGILFRVLFAICLRSVLNSQIGIRASSRSVELCGAKVIENIFGEEPVCFYYDNLNHLLPFHVSNHKILLSDGGKMVTRWTFNNFVIQATNLSTFKQSMVYLCNTNQNNIRDGRFLVITDRNDLARAILKWFWEINIVYVAVLAIDIQSSSESLLFTGDPNDALNDCGRQLNVIHNQSCIGSITDTIPKATRNYNGCSATVGIYVKSRYDFDPRDYTFNITREILNISFVFVDYSKSFIMPDIYGDMLLSHHTFENCRVSPVFARDNVVFVVPPAEKISYIEVLIVAFKKEVWLSILLGFVLFAATWYLICRFKVSMSTIVMNTVRITLCGSSNYIPNRSTARFLIMCYIIYSIHIQTAYIAELMRLLVALPTGKHIKSLDELMSTNLSILLDLESAHMFQLSDFNNTLGRLRVRGNQFCNPHNLTKNWYANKTFSYGILLKTLQSIELDMQVSSPPYFVENKILPTVMNVLAATNRGYFIDSMTVIIVRLTESGLYYKLDQDRKFDAEAKKNNFICKEDVVALSLEHLGGVFVVFGCGLLLSTVAFFGELFVHRFKK